MAKVFFSYSHKDESLRNELEVHLSMLKRQGLINAWHDKRITAGNDIHSHISNELESADIILLLVSAHFLASDYCYEKEMQRALDRNNEGAAKVIPIILHPCDWRNAPFGSLRATPFDGKPVSMFANQNEALAEIAKDIRESIESLGTTSIKELFVPPSSDTSQIISPPIQVARSANLRLKKKFTDHEVDEFLESSFEYIARYFKASLNELQERNLNITTKFRRVDANCFTSSIYDEGSRVSECTIWYGDNTFVGGIAYYGGITTSRNQFNEILTIENDGYSLFLKSMGMPIHRSNDEAVLSQEGAAELYWSLLIECLQ